jgi:hypothetical protein
MAAWGSGSPGCRAASMIVTCISTMQAKSVSAETTFFDDISRYDDLVPVLRGLSEQVSHGG